MKVDVSADERVEFERDIGEPQIPRYMTWLKLYEDIDITVGSEVSPQDGTEKGQFDDVVAAAELSEGVWIHAKPTLHERTDHLVTRIHWGPRARANATSSARPARGQR